MLYVSSYQCVNCHDQTHVVVVITHSLSWVRRGVTMYQGLTDMLPRIGTVL
jgi:hypothetical protein